MVADARRLLNYAVSRGLVNDASIIGAITAMERESAGDHTPSQPATDAFLAAYNALSKLTDGVTAESLSPEANEDARRTRIFYVSILVILLVVLVPVTTIALVGNHIIVDSLQDIDWVCLNERQIVKCPDQAYLPQTSDADRAGDFLHRYDTSVRTARVSERMRVVGYSVFMPPPPKLPPKELLDDFYNTRLFADRAKTAFELAYGTFAEALLPIAFAALGAVAFGLRDLRQRIESRTWVRQGQALPVLRIVIAALAGYMISVFGDFGSKSGLSPVALAFVIGYSVDVFFAFIDSFVSRLKLPLGAAARTA